MTTKSQRIRLHLYSQKMQPALQSSKKRIVKALAAGLVTYCAIGGFFTAHDAHRKALDRFASAAREQEYLRAHTLFHAGINSTQLAEIRRREQNT